MLFFFLIRLFETGVFRAAKIDSFDYKMRSFLIIIFLLQKPLLRPLSPLFG